MIRIYKTGPHAHCSPLSHAALWPLFADQITLVDTPAAADLYLFAHIRDIEDAPQAVVEDWRRRRRPVVLLCENPSWDATGDGSPLSPHIYVETRFGALPVHQLNHHTSDIFRFDRIPYALLTHHRFAGAYAYRFARNARRSVSDWRKDFAARSADVLFSAEGAPHTSPDLQWPDADLEGLRIRGARFAEACGAGRVDGRLIDRPAGCGDRNTDWHLDTLTRRDGCARFIAAVEAAHQPNYMTEKVFDAFACGAVPLYYASPHHRIHDFGLPAGAWVNLHGHAPEDLSETLSRQIDVDAYREAQAVLSRQFGGIRHWQQERQRLCHEVMIALRTVLDTPAAPARALPRLAKPGARLARFQNAHAGERCVLVCNGPSLNQMDLRPLGNETVIGLNKIYMGFEDFGFEAKYLVAVNDKVVAQSADTYAQLSCTRFLTDRAFETVPAGPRTFHMRTHGIEPRFSKDLTRGLHEGYTVTHAALQVAYFMGFSEVVIIGMDHRFEVAGPPNAPLHMQGADPNHFSPDYFRDQAWDAPDLVESEKSYRAARAAFEADNRRIWDATLGGACTVFPKLPYHRLSEL